MRTRSARQFKLPIDAVPPLLIEHGLRDAHPFPLAKWHKSEVTRRGGRRVTTAEAFDYPLVEMQPANSRALIALGRRGGINKKKLPFGAFCSTLRMKFQWDPPQGVHQLRRRV